MLKLLFVFSLVLTAGLTSFQYVFAEKKRVAIVDGAADRETDEYYSPKKLTVNEGTTIIWKNNDNSALHTITSGSPEIGYDGKFDSGFMEPGTTFQFTFDKPGNYDYFCTSLHQFMRGEISVVSDAMSFDEKTTSSSTDNNNQIN